IEAYLPEQLDEDAVRKLIDEVVAEQGEVTKQTMGATIAAVKAKAGGAADGAVVAKLVKEQIS
ncbi:MAG TPA: GatB/YqeY domain-containing protein, partial [Candidatus Limnocylindrales bacterium]|nr:GatB/YqeY domain-containing protein [Candidatus Limnocylindrales bacterium]